MTRSPRSQLPNPPAAESDEFLIFAREEIEDRKRFRWALVVAAFVHVGLFLVTLPELAAEIREPEPQKVFVVTPVRFRLPPPEPQRDIPPQRAQRIPVPDPTPDDPEPLVTEPQIEMTLDAIDTGIIGIPEAPPPFEPSGPIRVRGNVRAPVKIFAPPPVYTEHARRARVNGLVIVEAVIDQTGSVTNVNVLKGLPLGLDRAAVDAIREWTFEPATLNGKPVSVLYNLTVNFQLQ